MSGRRIETMDLRELLRYLQTEASNRQIATALGLDRRTVGRYRQWATQEGLLEGSLPPIEELQALVDRTLGATPPPQNTSTVAAYRAEVLRLRQAGVEIAAIYARLGEQGFQGSYQAVYRFVKALEPASPEVVVRLETAPGVEAQVDFGYAGKFLDPQTGKPRKAWVFVLTLSWSRHQYAELVWDQSLATWIQCHRHALEFLGGVPQRLVIDNLKAAISRASFDDPQVQVTYRECAEHYGFLIAPCRPRTPEHKGKVEQGGVHYVKRNFLAGRAPQPLSTANIALRQWCLTTAGRRVHGTTKAVPLTRFETTEQAVLQPLPATPYDLSIWKIAKVARDGHITFEQAYYSVPCAQVGRQVQVRGSSTTVRIYDQDYHLLTTHDRAAHPGTRVTKLEHLPPEKVAGVLLDRPMCQATAAEIGPATAQVVQHLLDDPAIDRLRPVISLLGLRETYGDTRLEAACARALHFDEYRYGLIKRILQQGQEHAPLPPPPDSPPPARTFVRTAQELLGQLFGGTTWN
jgi:transposase